MACCCAIHPTTGVGVLCCNCIGFSMQHSWQDPLVSSVILAGTVCYSVEPHLLNLVHCAI